MAELAQNIIDELHNKKGLPLDADDPLVVVKPGEGKPSKALAAKPTKEPKVVDKPLPKEEVQLINSITKRAQRVEDHRLSLTYEIGALKKLVEERADNWDRYRAKHLAFIDVKTVQRYLQDASKPDVAKALEDRRAKNAKANKKLRAKKGVSRDTRGKKLPKNAEEIEIFATWFLRGKRREDGDTVTVTWTRGDWNNVTSCLDKARGL